MSQRKTIRAENGSGAMSVMDDDADARYAISIFGEWHSALCSILRVSRACAEADATLSLSDKKGLIAQLPFQKSVFSKLADIGRNHTLQETPILNALPADWTTLHVLIGWSPEELHRAVSENILTPRVSRAELKNWIAKQQDRRRRSKQDPTTRRSG